MIKAQDLKPGDHFWAVMGDKLVAMMKAPSGFYVCGEWECSISASDFDIIEAIDFPKGYGPEQLYYNY